MIARVLIYLPFKILIHREEQFPTYSIKDSNYTIRFYPPGRDPDLIFEPEPKIITMDKKDAFYANFIQIDFSKDNFDMVDKNLFDPPTEKINEVLNLFLLRLKHATSSPQIHPLPNKSYPSALHISMIMENLLTKKMGKLLHRTQQRCEFNYVALNTDLWNDTFSLPSDLKLQDWRNLLLDAHDEMPNIQIAIVLYFYGLEIFISEILK